MSSNFEDTPSFTRSYSRSNNFNSQYASFNDFDDLTPEEIFNLFFTGIPPTRRRTNGRTSSTSRSSPNVHFQSYSFGNSPNNSYRSARTNNLNNRNNNDQSLFSSLFQLLPILLLLLFTLFSNSSSQSDPVFSLVKTNDFKKEMKVTNYDIFYYVKDNFSMEQYNIKDVESAVKRSWLNYKVSFKFHTLNL